MLLTSERARQLLAKSEAVLDGHFVGTNGNHLSLYVAKDRATRFPSVVSELCLGIAEQHAKSNIEAVVAPAIGGVALSQWTAYHLSLLRPDLPEVLALYTEHQEEARDMIGLAPGEQMILRKPEFVLKRGFGADVKDKRVLVVEDVLTTGRSAAQTIQVVRANHGIFVSLGVLANGGNVTARDMGIDWFGSLVKIDRQIFTEEDCAHHGLCAQGVPINTDFGHGKSFLARKQGAAS